MQQNLGFKCQDTRNQLTSRQKLSTYAYYSTNVLGNNDFSILLLNILSSATFASNIVHNNKYLVDCSQK